MNSRYDYSFKLVLVGDPGVGKSCLLTRFCENTHTDRRSRSFGIGSKTKFIDLDDKKIKLQMWDRESYNISSTVTPSHYRGVHGIIVVYDCTNWDSFDNVKQWFEKIDRYADKNVNKLLVGNKCDCVAGKVVDHVTAKEYATQLKIPFLETCAKNGTRVDRAFMTLASEIKDRFDNLSIAGETGRRLLANVKELNEELVLDDYENNFLIRMNEMRKQNRFCDVKFNTNGIEFPCHKIMLINATLDSEYFQTLFNSGFSESSSETIQLHDVEPDAMEEILNAIYTTRFNLHRSNAYYILRASHMFLLTDIFNLVVSRILENPGIDYLIETCLFAKLVERDGLHQRCISAIAADLNNLSKTDSFNEEITFEMFKTILKHENLIKDEKALFQAIMQWSNYHKISQYEVLQLLTIVNLRSGCLDMPTMAKLIVNSYTTTTTSDEIPNQNENAKQIPAFNKDHCTNHRGPEVDVCCNVYLNTVDVKSGAKGWAIMQSKPESNEYKIINYVQSNSLHRKVKKIGNKLYCFEYDIKSKKILFYCYENDEKTYLASPWSFNKRADSEYYDIEVLDKFIYLITSSGKLWSYNCETNDWTELTIEHRQESQQIQLGVNLNEIFSTSPKLTSYNGELFVVGMWEKEPFTVIPNQRLSAEYFKKCPREFTNPAVCCYDKKLVICGSDHDNTLHNIVSVYDTVAQNWYHLEDMNIGRADHTLNYRNGFLYAIENKSAVPNEKYDINLNKWTFIPSFPQRLDFTQENITLATGSVFNCTV